MDLELTDKQSETLKQIRKKNRILLFGGSRCLHPSTAICTPNGYKPISEISIGDLVQSVNELGIIEPKKVVDKLINTGEHLKHNIIIFVLNNGTKIQCSYEHRFKHEGGYVNAYIIAERVLERNSRRQRAIQSIKHGTYSVDELQKEWQSSSIKTSIGRKWIPSHYDSDRWKLQNNKGTSRSCFSLVNEPEKQTSSKSYKSYQIGQQNREFRVGHFQGEYRSYDEAWTSNCQQWRKKRYAHLNRERCSRNQEGFQTKKSDKKNVVEKIQLYRKLHKGCYINEKLEARELNLNEIKNVKYSNYSGNLIDIEVADNHNFIITKNNIISHNSGKTFLILFILFQRALKIQSRHLIVRKHSAHLSASIIFDTLPKVAKLLGIEYTINKQLQNVTLSNGSEIWWGGLDDKERVEKILGTEYSTIFANEVSTISYHAIETLLTRLAENVGLTRKFYLDENPPSKNHWSYKLFIENKNPESNVKLTNPENYIAVQMNPADNPTLPEDYITDTLMQLSERKRKRFMEGVFTDLEGSLWSDAIINPYRVDIIPELKRVVIAIDPAVTKTETSDETGIIICGEDHNNHYYVIEDCTGKYSPNEWANLIDRKVKEWKADIVVCEVNNGGDLVESNIRTVNKNIRVKKIHVSRGKMVRAEPIAGIYEQGRVHHVGNYRKLEDELTTYDGTGDSPNRMDALVFAISELSNEKIGIFVTKRI